MNPPTKHTPDSIDAAVATAITRGQLNQQAIARYNTAAQRELLGAFQDASEIGYCHGQGCALLFMGRQLEACCYFGAARLVYLKARTMLRGEYFKVADNYLKACPSGNSKSQSLYESQYHAVERGEISADDLVCEHLLHLNDRRIQSEAAVTGFWAQLARILHLD